MGYISLNDLDFTIYYFCCDHNLRGRDDNPSGCDGNTSGQTYKVPGDDENQSLLAFQ